MSESNLLLCFCYIGLAMIVVDSLGFANLFCCVRYIVFALCGSFTIVLIRLVVMILGCSICVDMCLLVANLLLCLCWLCLLCVFFGISVFAVFDMC